MNSTDINFLQKCLEDLESILFRVYNRIKNENWCNIKSPIKFQCNYCGKCCEAGNHGIFIGIIDLKNWFNNDLFYFFGLLAYDNITHKFTIITYENFMDLLVLKNELTRNLIAQRNICLNDLKAEIKNDLAWSKLKNYCIFYDYKNSRCSIYENRPLICKLYPIAHLSNNIIINKNIILKNLILELKGIVIYLRN